MDLNVDIVRITLIVAALEKRVRPAYYPVSTRPDDSIKLDHRKRRSTSYPPLASGISGSVEKKHVL